MISILIKKVDQHLCLYLISDKISKTALFFRKLDVSHRFYSINFTKISKKVTEGKSRAVSKSLCSNATHIGGISYTTHGALIISLF